MPLVIEQYHAIHETDEQSASKILLVDVTDPWYMTRHIRQSRGAVDAKGWRASIPCMPRANSL